MKPLNIQPTITFIMSQNVILQKGSFHFINCLISILFSCSLSMNKNINSHFGCFRSTSMTECLNQTANNVRSYYQTDVDISGCFFSRTQLFDGFGGILYISGSSYCVRISYSTFKNASASYAGVIYCNSNSFDCKMSCVYGCSASMFLFGHIETISSNTEYVSMNACFYQGSGNYLIEFYAGDSTLCNDNISNNRAAQCPAFRVFRSTQFYCSHSTFDSNVATNSYIIRFLFSSSTMVLANIVNNFEPVWGIITVSDNSNATLSYCIFNNNKHCLFKSIEGSILVHHSFIAPNEVIDNPNVQTLNNSILEVATFQHSFFKSFYCHADISIPHHTPFPTMTFEQTLPMTYDMTPFSTLPHTPLQTYARSPLFTIPQTPIQTQAKSPHFTPLMTPHRTYDQGCLRTIDHRFGISSIFSMTFLQLFFQ